MEVREGDVAITVPELATDGRPDGVFYNPRQERNRDITIAALRAFRQVEDIDSYLDATTATGVRGVRAAADGWNVTCCDRDPRAVERAEANLADNNLEGEVLHRDANAVMHERDFDVIDLDPFGSPIGLLDAAFSRPRRLVCVTATDTAPLCGAHRSAGIRRYSAVPLNTEYHREVGLRILLSAIARTAARYDVAVEPLLSHTEGHYVRTYLALDRGASVADAAIDQLGGLWHCERCLHRETERGLNPPERRECPACGEDGLRTAGPIWLGSPHDATFVERAIAHLDGSMGERDAAESTLATIAGELDRPTYFDQHVLCKQWNRTAPAMDPFLEALRKAGHAATHAHYGGTTFKTDARVDEIETVTANAALSS